MKSIVRNTITTFVILCTLVFAPVVVQEFLTVEYSSFCSVEAKQKKKSNNLTKKAKSQSSNAGKYKVFKCKKCGKEVKTTLDAYKAMPQTYQKGYCSAGCKNSKKKKK